MELYLPLQRRYVVTEEVLQAGVGVEIAVGATGAAKRNVDV